MGYIELTGRDMRAERKLADICSGMIGTLPEGHLVLKRISGRFYIYRVRPGSSKQEYISVDDVAMVEALRDRRYAEIALKILEGNIKAQERMLKTYRRYERKDILPLLGESYRVPLIRQGGRIEEPGNEMGSNGYMPEGLIHRTTFGLMVRSKSEAILAELFNKYGLSFKYEEPLYLYDEYGIRVVRYPDFTIYLKDGRIIYWEHLGMLTDENYRANTYKKLELYYANGILPGSNLIITCDDMDGAIDIESISKIVESLVG